MLGRKTAFDIGVLLNDIGSFSDTRKLGVIEKVSSPCSDRFVFLEQFK